MPRLNHLLLAMLWAPIVCLAAEAEYNPSTVDEQAEVETLDLTVYDAARERDIPLRVYLPASSEPAAVVLFSHGLGGSCQGNRFMGRHWARRGYVAVFLQHPGSDTSVWQGKPPRDILPAMREAASGENFMLRVRDVPAVLERLQAWNDQERHGLAGRLDLEHVGMSGHSFGAVTTQAVSGQAIGQRQPFTDERIDAAIAFSPSSPRVGDPTIAFALVKIPWLLMTGTKDTAVIGDTTVESRLAVFPALPPGSKYELVLDNAEHSAFTDRALPGDTEQRNANHHRAILAISTAFWDAYLRDDAEARAWLDGEGPRSVLEEADRWQRK